jgi:hypothetical protein
MTFSGTPQSKPVKRASQGFRVLKNDVGLNGERIWLDIGDLSELF